MSDTFDHEGNAWDSYRAFSSHDPPLIPKTCKHCGTNYLYWNKTKDGWRLAYSTGKIHECKGKK